MDQARLRPKNARRDCGSLRIIQRMGSQMDGGLRRRNGVRNLGGAPRGPCAPCESPLNFLVPGTHATTYIHTTDRNII